MEKVLIVGAGGFVGSFLCEEALRRNYDVWAGIRESTSRRYLQDPKLKFVIMDFSSEETLLKSIESQAPQGGWDYIVYNLGLTKAINFTEFNRVNYSILQSFTSVLHKTGLIPGKMLYISSLSVMGPGADGQPFDEKKPPLPDTRYGASKLKAEMWLATAGIPYIIFRATGIYGPRENDYYLMYKSIARGFDFSVGFKPQALTFIYVEDLARAVFDAIEKAPVNNTYIISENASYSQKQFRKIVLNELGKRFAIPIKLPLWAVKTVSVIAEKIGALRGKPSTLNRDKYHIMRQRNWKADTSKARADFGFNPIVSLKEGIRLSIAWNKAHHRL